MTAVSSEPRADISQYGRVPRPVHADRAAHHAGRHLREGSVVSLDNTQLVPVDRLLRRAGRISPDRWPEFCAAMAKVMAC